MYYTAAGTCTILQQVHILYCSKYIYYTAASTYTILQQVHILLYTAAFVCTATLEEGSMYIQYVPSILTHIHTWHTYIHTHVRIHIHVRIHTCMYTYTCTYDVPACEERVRGGEGRYVCGA